jgi:O-glycosyl hydrolase
MWTSRTSVLFNETDAYPTQGPRIDPGEVSNVLDAVARQLKKDGLADVKLAVADQAEPAKDFISPILKDTELMKQVGALTLHIYRDNDAVTPHVEHIKESKYPQTPVWVTEYGELDDLNRTAENEWKGFSISAERRALKALNQGASALLIWDALDEYDDSVQRLCYYGLFRSAGHVYAPKKRYYAAKQLYHFVPPGSQRIAATAMVSGVIVSAFRNVQTNSLMLVGVKEGGPNHIHVTVPDGEPAPATWDVYETTREVDCLKVDSVLVKDGDAELDLPEAAIFTLVGALPKLP